MASGTPPDASRYRELFDAVQDILYIRDFHGVILDINEAGARFFGRSKDELIGRTLHGGDQDNLEARSLQATNERLMSGGTDRSTVELRSASGEGRILESTTTLIHQNGVPSGAYGIMRDITEAVRLQGSLEKANRDLRQAMDVIAEDHARKTEELEEARALQLSLLPKELPRVKDLDIAVHMRTATEVGGDYYDFVIGDDGSLTVAVGDASGHGFKAGVLAATAKSYFQSLAQTTSSLDILQNMTAGFRNLNLRSLYMCMSLLRFHESHFSIAAAGMPPLLLRRLRDGQVETVFSSGIPLGLYPGRTYTESHFDLDRGDTILLMSDGLAELFNSSQQEFGYERVETCLQKHGEDSAEGIVEELVSQAEAWAGSDPPDDDITLVVMKMQ